MYEVDLIFEGETNVWMTEEVVEAILKHDGYKDEIELENPNQGLLAKIKYYSDGGFRRHEGKKRPIKHEGDGVYRIGYGDLFRIYGFYEDEIRKKSFIAVRPHADKKGRKNTKRERRIISEVAKIRKSNDEWKKRNI